MHSEYYGLDALEPRVLLSSLPAGFVEAQVATDMPTPTAMAFAPDGRLFVTQQSGEIRVFHNGQLNPQDFAQVNTDAQGERGLLGIALDPTFGQPGGQDYVYVYYTTDKLDSINNRISRFLANGDVASGPEQIVLDLPVIGTNVSGPIWHMGGALNFGLDGKLYVSQGDGQDSNAAQSLDNLKGKILRINKDGSIPTDNPFYSSLDGINRSIWAYGLRNPFTTAMQPGTGRFYLNDVGEETWEEIDVGAAGANYGWPLTEGDFDQAQYPNFTRPLVSYSHSLGTCVVGGAFYNPATDTFPSAYHGQYFFGDFTGGFIKTLDPQTGVVTPFASGTSWITGLKLAPDGSLWYMTRGSADGSSELGSVYIIQPTNSDAPSIVKQPKDQLVAVGEDATFSVEVQGVAPFEFQWQRDGVDIDGANSASYTISNVTFADAGSFRCVVTNNYGTATSLAGRLTVANTTRPVPTIIAPAEDSMYSGGDLIEYNGSGIDEQDGLLPASAFTWRVDFQHDQHSHPFIPPTSGVKSGSFVIPTVGETSDNVWYRIYLTVTDSDGLSTTTYRDIQPRKANVQFATNIPGMSILLDGQPHEAPLDVVGVQGLSRLLDAAQQQAIDGNTYEFVGWSDGGERQHTIAFPSADTVYTAFYRYESLTAQPLVIQGNSGNDAWTLRMSTDGANLLIYRNTIVGPPQSVPISTIDTITINGLGGNDSLTLDAVNGAFAGIGKITFNGGDNANATGDTLAFMGTNQADVFDATADSVFYDALPVSYADVENLRVVLAAGDDIVRVNETTDAALQIVGGTGSNALEFFGGEYVIDTDLGDMSLGLHNDADMTILTSQHLAALTLSGDAHVKMSAGRQHLLRTGALSIAGHAVLDLNDNDFMLDYTGASELPAIEAWIAAARAGGAWTGEGITSTLAKNADPKILTLGAMEASDFQSVYGPGATFDGEAIDGSAVLVKFTYYGDTDFNGKVDFDDYSRIDSGFRNGRSGWLNGDFDGNGHVDFDDYSLIDLAFNRPSAPLRPAALPAPARKPARGTTRA